ncbi:hypothetical protein [Raineya sp.]
MNIEDFIQKYVQASTSVFQPTPPANITDEDMRIFADDIRKAFSTENVEDSTKPLMTKRIGFYKNNFFTGVQISYHRETENILFLLIRNDTAVLDLSFLSGNRLNNTELVNCWTLSNLGNITEYNIINKNNLYEGISRVVYTGISRVANRIMLPNTNTKSTKKKKFFVEDEIINDAQVSNPDFFFYYDYGYLSNLADALGDEFEVYFKARFDGSVYFSTFNYDYYCDTMEVLAGAYYKLSVCMMPKYSDGFPHVWANLTRIATPVEN